jgi:hypothetical protein
MVFLPLSALLLWRWGIAGAAVAWACRAAADFGGKLWLAGRLCPAAAGAARALAVPALFAGAALGAVVLAATPAAVAAIGSVGLLVCAWALLRALSPEERRALRDPRSMLRPA